MSILERWENFMGSLVQTYDERHASRDEEPAERSGKGSDLYRRVDLSTGSETLDD